MAITLAVSQGDIVLSQATGQPGTVTGLALLQQELQEFFQVNITVQGFGAGLDQLIGTVPIDSSAMMGLMYTRIQTGIQQFIALQRSNTKVQYNTNELVLQLLRLQVAQNPEDPTAYFFNAIILTQSGITFNIPIAVPQ